MNNKYRVILGVCGSIAAYKACDLVRRLQDSDIDVMVALTKEAAAFVTPLTFEALSQKAVYQDLFDNQAWEMAHIQWAKAVDGYVIAPATAQTIAKLAHGLCDDPVSALAVTVKCPIIVAPAMNDDMLASSAVQENLAKLKSRGVYVIDAVCGKLACGVVGMGHLADVETIVQQVVATLKK